MHDYVEDSYTFPNDFITIKRTKSVIRDLYWIVESICSLEEYSMSSKADDYSTMEFLQTVSMNAAKPHDLEVELIKENKLKITEGYIRNTYNPKELLKSDIDKMLIESLCLLLQTKEAKMILPGTIGYDKKRQAWKFIVTTIFDRNIPKAYPVLNWAITIYCSCFSKDWINVIKDFEGALDNEDKYNKVLVEYLSIIDNEDVRNTFNRIMRYSSLYNYQRLKDINCLNVSRNMIIKNSVSRVASKVDCFDYLNKDNKIPYVVLECNHTMSFKQGTEQLYYWLWLERIGPYSQVRCDACGSFVFPKQINLNCGCEIQWKESTTKAECKCEINTYRPEDIAFTQGEFTDNADPNRFYVDYLEKTSRLSNIPSTIEVLDMQKTSFISYGEEIYKSLKKMNKLYSLNLFGAELTGKNMNLVISGLEFCKNLQILDLGSSIQFKP